MDCSIVAISRSIGAHGEEIAQSVASQLGFRYVDDEIISRAAAEAGVSPDQVSEVEHTQPLIMRILTRLATASPEPLDMMVAPAEMPLPDYSSRVYQDLIRDVIGQTAQEGKAVIIAHGASIPLAGTPGLLRVLITGSAEVRAQRVATAANLSEKDAQKAVEDSDNQRHEFLRRFYNVRQELSTHYDLVVNTDVLSDTEAASLIVAATKI